MKYRYSIPELERMESNPWLTDRERQVFDLFYHRGWAQEDVAAELYVCKSTVRNDLRSIRKKNLI